MQMPVPFTVSDLLTEGSRNLIRAENAMSHFISCNSFFTIIAEKSTSKGRSRKTLSKRWFYLSYNAVIFQKL